MPLRLGIDIACRAAHQVSLADEQGRFIWTGRRFRTTPQDLARLWSMLPEGTDPADIVVVMEPTRNAWVPLAAWFRRRGAEVVLVPPERSADLRRYYAKHTKSDRLDSQLLARLPILHPDGLHAEQGLGPGDALKRAAKLHSTLTHRRSQSLARLDALLEILGPAWHAAIGGDLANRTPVKFLAAGYADPHVVKRLGRTRLARFCYRHSRGAWGEPHADALLAAAQETLQLWSRLGSELAVEMPSSWWRPGLPGCHQRHRSAGAAGRTWPGPSGRAVSAAVAASRRTRVPLACQTALRSRTRRRTAARCARSRSRLMKAVPGLCSGTVRWY
jgi:Transposase